MLEKGKPITLKHMILICLTSGKELVGLALDYYKLILRKFFTEFPILLNNNNENKYVFRAVG